jgi:Ca2+-binding RTX toxin-like protein
MNKFANRSVITTLMSFAILATIFSVQLKMTLYPLDAHAQQFPVASPSNSTDLSPLSNLSLANQTGESLVESFGPLSQMEAVIRELENTNATSFAARQQIETITSNMTGNMSSNTGALGSQNMTGNMSNNTGATGSQNMTGDSTNDTAMRAVIEQTVNTNATGFAANNLINMTTPQSAGP